MTWQAINLAAPEFAKPSLPPVIGGLLYVGKRHLLSGPPEAAKTLLALILALEEIRDGGIVSIIDFESGPSETRRVLEDLGATADELASVMYFEPDGPPDATDIRTIVENGSSLAIVDALAGAYDASGLDDEKRKDVERFARQWIRPLWQAEVKTVAIDHVVKNADNRGKFSIGSERKLGAVDVHLGLKPIKQLHRGSTGLIRISTHKDRPAHLERPHAADIELASDPVTHRITWRIRPANDQTDDAPWMPTGLMQRVSEYLERQADEVPVGNVYRDVKGKREYLVQAVTFLLDSRHITERPGNRGSRLIRSNKPYRDPFPTGSHPFPDPGDSPVPVFPPPLGGDGDGTQEPELLDAYWESIADEMTAAGELA